MTKQADFKRRVRARMARTGESYATARRRLLAEHPGATPDDSPRDWMPEALRGGAPVRRAGRSPAGEPRRGVRPVVRGGPVRPAADHRDPRPLLRLDPPG